MSDTNDNGNGNDRPGGRTLGLRGGGQSRVRQNFSHGRSKTVVVETKRKRIIGGPGAKPAAPAVAEAPAPAPTPPPVQNLHTPRQLDGESADKQLLDLTEHNLPIWTSQVYVALGVSCVEYSRLPVRREATPWSYG